MSTTGPDTLKRTVLYPAHLKAGAKLIPFAGWEMPVNYPGGILAEVRSVRRSAGMFDVSHMARLRFSGPGAASFLDYVLSADVKGLRQGRSRYHVICDDRGGIIDDAIVYCVGEGEYLLVVNAGNTDRVLEWFDPILREWEEVELFNYTDQVAMIAVQGPQAAHILDRVSGYTASPIRPFRISEVSIQGARMRVSRTGYTGEDGFEVMPPRADAQGVWERLREEGVEPCGLGARDVLRLEAGLHLHGNDITRERNPFEAGLGRFVKLGKERYVAGDALQKIKEQGTPRTMVGFTMIGRGIPRQTQTIVRNGQSIGEVTSGTHSPTLDANIGMGYVDRAHAVAGTRFEIDVRGRLVEAEVVPLPFYSRRR